jgi:hypothetical protein
MIQIPFNSTLRASQAKIPLENNLKLELVYLDGLSCI